jgi:hypothetical protein
MLASPEITSGNSLCLTATCVCVAECVVKLCEANRQLKFVCSGRLADGGSERQNVQAD